MAEKDDTAGRTPSVNRPLLALFAVMLLAFVGAGWLAAWQSDQLARERQEHILAASLNADLEADGRLVRDYAWWNDTQRYAVDSWDQDWVDENIGRYMFQSFNVAATMVLAPNGALQGFVRDEEREGLPATQAFYAIVPELTPLLRKAAETQLSDPAGQAGFFQLDGKPFLVSVGAITPEIVRGPEAERLSRSFLVYFRYLDADVLNAVARRLLLSDLHFNPLADAEEESGMARLVVRSPSGQAIGALEWKYYRPGLAILRIFVPMIGIAALLVLGIGAVVLFRAKQQASVLEESLAFLAQRNEELIEARRSQQDALLRALESDRTKMGFLQAISHELRSPLNSILGYASLLRRELPQSKATARHHEHLYNVERAGTHLLSLVNKLIDAARLEGRAYALDDETLDLASHVEAVLRRYGDQANQNGLALLWLPGKTASGLTLRADARSVRQMVGHLVDNALRYSPHGGQIIVRSTVCEAGQLNLSVEDEGPGLPPAIATRIGQPFLQLSEMGEAGGPTPWGRAGLGLYLTRLMMEMHGGRLELQAAASGGVKACLIFPANRVVPEVETGERQDAEQG